MMVSPCGRPRIAAMPRSAMEAPARAHGHPKIAARRRVARLPGIQPGVRSNPAAIFSAIMMTGMLVLALGRRGITEASDT